MRRSAIFVALVFCLISGFCGRLATAQTLHLDPNGVDVMTSQFTFSNPSISIGPRGSGGLTYAFLDANQPQKDAYYGTVTMGSSMVAVNLSTVTDHFYSDPSYDWFREADGTGATLVLGAQYLVYTTKDGVQYFFDQNTFVNYTNYVPNYNSIPEFMQRYLLYKINWPNGDSVNINYRAFPVTVLFRGTCYNEGYYRRQSVTSNTGYQLIYAYQSDSLPPQDCERTDDPTGLVSIASDLPPEISSSLS